MNKYLHGVLSIRQLPKINVAMKLAVYFLIASSLQIHANSDGQPTKPDLNYGYTNVVPTYNEMGAVSESRFSYKSDRINLQYIVSGNVNDEFGQPLPGASIVEKGTTNGTQTDFDGNFSIGLTDENAV